MAEFTPITTQEQLDQIISDRLKRERETVSRKYGDYDDLKSKVAAYETDISGYSKSLQEANEKLAAHDRELAERDAKIKGYETASVKTRIAHEAGLPYELAGRLTGEDEDAIRKDAEHLSRLIGQTVPAAPLASTESGTTDTRTAALKNTLAALKGD